MHAEEGAARRSGNLVGLLSAEAVAGGAGQVAEGRRAGHLTLPKR